MRFKYWFYINEAIDPKDKNDVLNSKLYKNEKDQSIKDKLNQLLANLEADEKAYNKGEIFNKIQEIIPKIATKKETDDAQTKLYKDKLERKEITQPELDAYILFKKENKAELQEMMNLLRNFISKNLITIEIKENKAFITRNNVTKQFSDLGRFMSELHAIESSLEIYKQKPGMFNPIAEELNHANNLVAKGDNVWVFKGSKPDVCRILGKNQKWCIASTSSATHWFNYRFNYGQTQYFVFDFNKAEDDPARYVNPGVAQKGDYSEWVDARNQHEEDPNDPNSEVGINGYNSIEEYKDYLASKGIPKSIWVTTEPEEWEKRLKYYINTYDIDGAKEDKNPEVFPIFLKVVDNLKGSLFDELTKEEKEMFLLGRIKGLTKEQLLYALNPENKFKKTYLNSLQIDTDDDQFVKKAAEIGNLEFIKFLVGKGAEVSTDALNYAVISNDTEIIKYVYEVTEKNRSNFQSILDQSLKLAISNKNIEAVDFLINNGAVPTESAVGMAVSTNDLEFVKYIVKLGAEINIYSLNWAVTLGQLEIFKYLERGFNENLFRLKQEYHKQIGREFKEKFDENKPIDENFVDEKSKQIFLREAAGSGNLDLVKYIESKYPAKSIDEELAKEILANAINSGDLDVVKYFVEEKNMPIAWDAIKEAANYKFWRIAKYLTGKVDSLSKSWRYLNHTIILIHAAESNNLKIVKFFGDKGAPITRNALIAAANFGNVNILKYFLEEKKFKNIHDKQGILDEIFDTPETKAAKDYLEVML